MSCNLFIIRRFWGRLKLVRPCHLTVSTIPHSGAKLEHAICYFMNTPRNLRGYTRSEPRIWHRGGAGLSRAVTAPKFNSTPRHSEIIIANRSCNRVWSQFHVRSFSMPVSESSFPLLYFPSSQLNLRRFSPHVPSFLPLRCESCGWMQQLDVPNRTKAFQFAWILNVFY